MMRRTLIHRIAVTAVATAACVLVAAGVWLGSSHGLHWAVQKIVRLGDGKVVVENAEGSLFSEVRIQRLQILDTDFKLEAETFILGWQPLGLLRGQLHLNRASAATLRYQSLTASPSTMPASLAFPLDISIAALEIARLEIGGLPAIENLRLAYSGGRTTHEIKLLQTRTEGWVVDGTLQISALPPYPIKGQLQAVRGTTALALQAKATVAGTLDELQIALAGSGRGASIDASATLRPYDGQLLAALETQARELDLSAWAAEWPRTRLTVDAHVSTTNQQLGGKLSVSNAAAGTLDSGRLPLSAINARFSGNDGRWTLPALEMLTPGGGTHHRQRRIAR